MFGILGSLLPLAVVGGIVYAVVKAAHRRADEPLPTDIGGGIRRLFQYVMLFAALMVAGIGLTGLLGRAIATAAVRSGDMAGTLALTLVGIPVFTALARWAWRTLTTDPAERSAFGWTLYLNAAIVVALSTTVWTIAAIIFRFIEGDGYDGDLVATVIVWGAIWIGHWMVWRMLTPTRWSIFHLLAGSGIGLAMIATGTGIVISRSLERAIEAGDVVAAGWGDDIAKASAVAAIGACVWAWHWLRHALGRERTAGWLVYVLLYGVLGGVVATVTGAGRAVFLVLEWTFGDPATTSATAHFAQLGPAVAATVVGLIIWQYHRVVIGPSTMRTRTDVDRTYDAIVAGAALATVATAVAILVVALFELSAPTAARGAERGGDVLLAALTLLSVGIPLWAVTWRRMQRLASAAEDETTSTPRRAYLFMILGTSGAIAFGAMIRLLVVVFEAWLGERSGSLSSVLQWPIALLVTTGAVAGYHWLVVRRERHLYAAEPRRDVLLVWGGDGELGDLLAITHANIRVLHRLDEAGAPVDVAAVAAAIEAATGEHLLIVAGSDGVRVVPYE